MSQINTGRSGRISAFSCRSSVSLFALLPVLALGLAPAALAQIDGPPPVALDEISVTANLVPTPARAVGSAVTVITSEELEQRQIRLVSDALREVPGLAVNRTGPVGQLTQVRIRGSEGNQTLVLIDGIRANDPSAGSEFDFAHLTASDIARIEVLRGPQSALYGSDAVGGVINIVTRRGHGTPSAELQAEGGSFHTGMGRAALSGGGETYDFIVSGTGSRTNGVSVADARLGNTESDGYRNLSGFAKANLRPVENLEISLIGRKVDFHADGDAFVGGIGAVDNDSDSSGDQFYGRLQGRLNLLDDRWEQILGVALTDHNRKSRTGKVETGRFRGTTLAIDYQSNLFLDTPDFLRAAHIATVAVQNEQNKAESVSAFSAFDRSIGSTGFVGQYQVTLAERLSLSGAVRHDRNDLFRDANTFRLTGAYFHAPTGTKLRTSYGTGVKNPTLFELYGFAANYQGNPDLKPERGTGWDIGIDQTFLAGRAIADATFFEQRIEDLIQGSGQTSINLPGQSRIRGLETGLSFQLMDGLSARAAYTYSAGRDSTGAELVRRPRNIASLNLDYRLPGDRANVNLGILYTGAQKDWAFDAAFNRRVVDLKSFVLVNLAGAYQVNDNVEVYARVENLLNTQYQEVYSYGAPGRAGYAGVKVRF